MQALPIGILGDGQLAMMLGESAAAQGIPFLGYGEDPESSFAVTFPDRFIQGKSNDFDALTRFAKQCSVLTLENEFFAADFLEKLSAHAPVIPAPAGYRHFENKIAQRALYESLLIPSPKWLALQKISIAEAVSKVEASFAYPLVLKASQGGYDGYGVKIIQNRSELEAGLQAFGLDSGKDALIEEKVAIQKEFAQGVLLDGKGGNLFLPLVETIQRHGICELVLSQSNAPTVFEKARESVANSLQKIAKSGLKGLFHFEFFLTDDQRILINEGAPRPHNSEHLTMNASPVSQFDILMAYLAKGSLPTPSLVKGAIPAKPAVMINLLGQSSGTEYELALPSLPPELEVHAKLYRKKICRPGRKMGHLTLVDPTGKLDLKAIGEKTLKEYRL